MAKMKVNTGTPASPNWVTMDANNSDKLGGQLPSYYATISGIETLINKILTAPKISSGSYIADANGNELIIFPSAVASAVNEITIYNAVTGGNPTIAATGSDTNVSLNLTSKGAGLVMVNGSQVATSSSVQLFTNKTLSAPKMSSGTSINDLNANELIAFPATVASAVNHIQINNAVTGSTPAILATGDDTNISLNIGGKGTGLVALAVNMANAFYIRGGGSGETPQIQVQGADTNVSLNLVSKGTGTIKANGVDITTISATQTLTNKTLTAPKIEAYVENINSTSGSGTITIDCSSKNIHYIGITGTSTIAFSNIPATGACSITIGFVQGGTAYAISYPMSVTWSNGTIPDTSGTTKTHFITFVTLNGGTKWYGFPSGLNFAN